VRRPVNQQEFYSGRRRIHSIKYEIDVHPESGHIVWMAGGADGRVQDLTMTRNLGLLQLLNPEEVILSDLGYIGEEQILTPHKNLETNKKMKRIVR
jgi:hypothetical protein